MQQPLLDESLLAAEGTNKPDAIPSLKKKSGIRR